MRIWFLILIIGFTVAPVGAQEEMPDSLRIQTEEDSLLALMAEVPLDSLLVELGDSLFLPKPGRARIVRDAYGVPHIYGQTDIDVSFGFGYAQAEDHLIPMLMNFRQARGQLSEVAGEEFLELDYKALLWRIHTVAGERYSTIPEASRSLVEAFADGINHYIEIHRTVIPAWVQPVSGVDVVAFSRWINFIFAENTGTPELRKLGLRTSLSALLASNQWVVGPPRSATGSPIFVMDPHLPWDRPFQFYEAHLVSNQGLNVAGGTLFGFPVIVMGHSDRIAWSMTVNASDVFDVYEEKLDPANPKRYFYNQEKERMASRRVKIRVRREQGVFEVERELLYTNHGPVYKFIEDWAYTGRSSVDEVVDLIGQFYAMNKAQNLEEFQRALSRQELATTNVMYGDTDGNTYYVFYARSPRRSEEFDWREPVPGWTSETEWQGILPLNQLPQLSNPASGFMQNCNTAAHLVTAESGIDPEAFPAYLGRGGFNDRGQRVLNWLFTHKNITVDQMMRLSKDNYLIAAEELKAVILRAYNRSWDEIYDPEGQVAAAINILRDWDNRATINSRSTLLFSVWKQRYDDLLGQIPQSQRRDDLVQDKLALEGLRMAVEYMMVTYGKLDVLWGDVHVLERGGEEYPMSGPPPGTTALHMSQGRRGEDGVYRIYRGTSYTMVVSLSQPVRAWSVLPYGNSEDPKSPHYDDQAELRSREAFKRVWFAEEEVFQDINSLVTVPLGPIEGEKVALRAWWKLTKIQEAEMEKEMGEGDEVQPEMLEPER